MDGRGMSTFWTTASDEAWNEIEMLLDQVSRLENDYCSTTFPCHCLHLVNTNNTQKDDDGASGATNKQQLTDLHSTIANPSQQAPLPLENIVTTYNVEDVEQLKQKLSDMGREYRSKVQETEMLVSHFNKVKDEIEKTLSKYDSEHRLRMHQKKLFKSKLFEFREEAKRVQLKYDEMLEALQTELTLTKTALNTELEYRQQIEDRNKQLLLEQKDLKARLADQEEWLRERVFDLMKVVKSPR